MIIKEELMSQIDNFDDYIIKDIPAACLFLEKVRYKQGLTIEDLAELADCSPYLFYQWKVGNKIPKLITMLRVANSLGFELVFKNKNNLS